MIAARITSLASADEGEEIMVLVEDDAGNITIKGDNAIAQSLRNRPHVPKKSRSADPIERFHAFIRSWPVYWSIKLIPKSELQEFGDVAGHPFHGNQYTGGFGGMDSPAEVKSALAKVFPNAEIEFRTHGSPVPEQLAKTYEGQMQYAKEAARGIIDMGKKYPAAAEQVRAIAFDPYPGNAESSLGDTNGMLGHNGVELVFHTGTIMMHENWQGTKDLNDPSWSISNRYSNLDWEKATYAVAVHEFGHVVDYAALQNGMDTTRDLQNLPNAMMDARSISDYATTNPAEAFAEAFAAKELGYGEGVPNSIGAELNSALYRASQSVTSAATTYEREDKISDTFEGSIIWEYAKKPVVASVQLGNIQVVRGVANNLPPQEVIGAIEDDD